MSNKKKGGKKEDLNDIDDVGKDVKILRKKIKELEADKTELEATNQNLSNVVVTLTDTTDNTNVKSGTSDNGVAEITGVKPGTYSVTATRDGYTAETIANVTVSNADVTVADAIVMNSN